MSIRRAFKAFFGDRDWLKKTGLGVLIMLIPYVGAIAFMGFEFHYLRDVAWGREERLPEWKDFGAHLKTGLYGFVVGMVYALPLSLVLGIIVTVVAVVGAGAIAYTESLTSIIWLVVAFFVAYTAMTVLMGAVLWPAYTQVALYDSIQAGFDFKGLWARTRANASSFWSAFGKSLLLAMMSFGIMLVVLAVLAGVFGLAIFSLDSDTAPLGALMIFPLEILAILAISLVTFPLTLMNNHIWGQYARIAYDLENAQVSEVVMIETYAEEPAPEYLPPPPTA